MMLGQRSLFAANNDLPALGWIVVLIFSLLPVIDADRKLIAQIRKAGMRPSQLYEFMKQFYGGAENIPFLMTDCNNEISQEQNTYLESNDAQTLLEYLKKKQIDPAFFMPFK
jgi:hypothetical protein